MKKITKLFQAFFLIFSLTACSSIGNFGDISASRLPADSDISYNSSSIPPYSEDLVVVLDDNQPSFEEYEVQEATTSYIYLSELDALGRCGPAQASLSLDTAPAKGEERGDISSVHPSGWKQAFYDLDGDGTESNTYERCHLLAWCLSGLNEDSRNLITGTHTMNVDGMLPFENMVDDYIEETGNHVLYRVTPRFEGNNLLATGVEMEGFSVEDNGQDICFHVFVYNVEPGISLDYATGNSWVSGETSSSDTSQQATACQGEIRGNKRSKIYHCQGQQAYDQMATSKNLVVFQTEQEALDAGYRKAKN